MKLEEVPLFLKEMYKDINEEKEQKYEKQLWDIYLQERYFLIMSQEKVLSFEEFKEKVYEQGARDVYQSTENVKETAMESEKEALEMLNAFY